MNRQVFLGNIVNLFESFCFSRVSVKSANLTVISICLQRLMMFLLRLGMAKINRFRGVYVKGQAEFSSGGDLS